MESMVIGIRHDIDQPSLDRIAALLKETAPGDEVTIELDPGRDEQAARVSRVLEDQGFALLSRGGAGKSCQIKARRLN